MILARGEIFVIDQENNTVSVISDATNEIVAIVDMGRQAYEPSSNIQACAAAYDSEKGEVFVAVANTKTISIISDTTNEAFKNITVGAYPTSLAYDSGAGQIFVNNDFDNTTSVISDTTNSVVATVPVSAYPNGIAYDSGRNEVFVVNAASFIISVLSDSGGSSSPSPTVQGVFNLTFAESGLPSGTQWQAIFNGAQYFSTSNTITINNISPTNYSWSIPNTVALNLFQGTGTDYSASPNSGTINASSFGSQSLQQITFSPTSNSSPSSTPIPTPTPTVPEFPSLAVLFLVTLATFFAAMRYKKPQLII